MLCVGGCLSAPIARADSFQGSVWSLSTNGADLDANPSTQTFEVNLTVNTMGYTGGGSFLESVALKVSSALSNAVLVQAPGGVGNWTIQSGGLGASGCNGAGSGFECAGATAIGGGAATPGIYSWIFDLTMANGALFTGAGQASVKGEFVNAQGAKVGALVSEPSTLLATPEPEVVSLLLAGSSLMGFIGFMGRGRRRAAAGSVTIA